MRFCETSAKTSQGVGEAIDQMVSEIVSKGGGTVKGSKLKSEIREPGSDSCCWLVLLIIAILIIELVSKINLLLKYSKI